MLRNRLVLLSLVLLVASLIGIYQTANGKFSEIAWPLIPLGIFIWGDALILAPFLFLLSLWLYFKGDSILTGLCLATYYSTRSFIEIIYALNAQFLDSVRPWELNWQGFVIVNLIGRQELFVISQLIFTCIFIASAIVFIHYFKKYLHLTK